MRYSNAMQDRNEAREQQIEAIAALCLDALDKDWLCQDVLETWSGCHETARAIAFECLTGVQERNFLTTYAAVYAAAGLVLIRDPNENRAWVASWAAHNAVSNYQSMQVAFLRWREPNKACDDDPYIIAADIYRTYIDGNLDGEVPWEDDDLSQVAADFTWGRVIGCLIRDEDVERRVQEALALVHSHEVLGVVRSRLEHLNERYKAWKRKRCQRVLMIMLCGAIACGMGMVLPMCWGALFPWALQVWGAVVGGLLGYKAASSRPSACGVALMLIGWAVTGLATGCLLWGVWPLVASYSTALATAMGVVSTTLCVGGAGSLWSKRVERGEGGQRHQLTE